jgi:hypothetical protein
MFVDRSFVESYNLETFHKGPDQVRKRIWMTDERLRLHGCPRWKAMQGGFDFSQGTTAH